MKNSFVPFPWQQSTESCYHGGFTSFWIKKIPESLIFPSSVCFLSPLILLVTFLLALSEWPDLLACCEALEKPRQSSAWCWGAGVGKCHGPVGQGRAPAGWVLAQVWRQCLFAGTARRAVQHIAVLCQAVTPAQLSPAPLHCVSLWRTDMPAYWLPWNTLKSVDEMYFERCCNFSLTKPWVCNLHHLMWQVQINPHTVYF